MTTAGETKCAIWLRVSTGHQESSNQLPDIQRFIAHHGYTVTGTYELAESAWNTKDGYKATLRRALDDAHAGKYKVLVVWALDRLTREGAEGALRIIRQFPGCSRIVEGAGGRRGSGGGGGRCWGGLRGVGLVWWCAGVRRSGR